jgi:hypothetical protein
MVLTGGCGSVCTSYVVVTDAGWNGSLHLSASSTLANVFADGGAVGPPFENAGDLGRSLHHDELSAERWKLFASGPRSNCLRCLAYLRGPGRNRRGAQYTPLCGDYSCGSIDLTLELGAVAGGGGPFVNGIAATWVVSGGEKEDCSSSGGGLTD